MEELSSPLCPFEEPLGAITFFFKKLPRNHQQIEGFWCIVMWEVFGGVWLEWVSVWVILVDLWWRVATALRVFGEEMFQMSWKTLLKNSTRDGPDVRSDSSGRPVYHRDQLLPPLFCPISLCLCFCLKIQFQPKEIFLWKMF